MSQSEALVIAAAIIGLALILGRPVQNIDNSNTVDVSATSTSQASGAAKPSGGGSPLGAIAGFFGL